MLRVQALRSGYGRIPILQGIGFSVAAGEFVGLFGHNGMGKTTLMRTLAGQLPATAGRIHFRDCRHYQRAFARTRPPRAGLYPARTGDLPKVERRRESLDGRAHGWKVVAEG